jgi:hypothetical protein
LSTWQANNVIDEKKPMPLRLPHNFCLDPVVYPTASRQSSKHLSLQRDVANHVVPSLDPSVDTPVTTVTFKHGHEGDNNDLSTSSILAPAPCRPPRPTRLDDLLLGFPYEARATRDVWYPLVNKKTGCWELGVVGSSAKDAQLLKNVDYRFVAEMREKTEKSADAVKEAVIIHSMPAPLDTYTEHPAFDLSPKRTKRNRKGGKSSKCRGNKARNAYPHGFEIPELHVNARPYVEIEAEEVLAAAATDA